MLEEQLARCELIPNVPKPCKNSCYHDQQQHNYVNSQDLFMGLPLFSSYSVPVTWTRDWQQNLGEEAQKTSVTNERQCLQQARFLHY